jgi:hypothetical protein
MKKTYLFLLFLISVVNLHSVHAQCNAVTTAAQLESCLEGQSNVTLAANINLAGFVITIPDGANVSVNMGAFNITWTGAPWVLQNPGVSTQLSFSNNSGSLTVVKNSPGPGEVTVGNFNSFFSAAAAIAALPIELISFEVYKKNANTVQITFATATEHNNERFEIERSTDGIVFEKIGAVKGAGSSVHTQHYSFEDTKPVPGVNYYRLRQVDFDNHFSYSEIEKVDVKANDIRLIVYPTQVLDVLHLQLGQALDTDAQWQIVDMAGQVVAMGQIPAEQTNASIDTGNLTKGLYVLRLTSAQQIIAQKFTK